MLRILYLDNDVPDMELMRRALSRQGIAYELVEATTKAQFIAALEDAGFAMIFSDSGVAGFDGKEALAVAKQFCPETIFIFLTGHSEGPIFEALKRSGADDVFSKHHLQWLGGAIGRALRAKKGSPE